MERIRTAKIDYLTWLVHPNIYGLTTDQKGILVDMLMWSIRAERLPKDAEKLATILGVEVEKVREAMPKLELFFVTDPEDSQSLVLSDFSRELIVGPKEKFPSHSGQDESNK